MKKLLIICGPTATGKTSLGLKLASLFNGQIISADSRQVFKGMDVGTGKDLPNNVKKAKDGHYLINRIKVWGYDLVTPNQEFSVAHFIDFAVPRIKKIWALGELPIVIGGTGLYLKALTQPFDTISIPVNQKLRLKLNKLTIPKLQQRLKKINPAKFKTMNHSDQHNPRRLIRAIEIKTQKGLTLESDPLKANFFWVGLKANKKILDAFIEKRVNQRITAGAQAEVKALIKKGYLWDLPAMSAMGYKQWRPLFEKKTNLDKVKQTWILSEKQYLRRQLTWFKSQKNINWFDISKTNFAKTVVTKVQSWYTK